METKRFRDLLIWKILGGNKKWGTLNYKYSVLNAKPPKLALASWSKNAHFKLLSAVTVELISLQMLIIFMVLQACYFCST